MYVCMYVCICVTKHIYIYIYSTSYFSVLTLYVSILIVFNYITLHFVLHCIILSASFCRRAKNTTNDEDIMEESMQVYHICYISLCVTSSVFLFFFLLSIPFVLIIFHYISTYSIYCKTRRGHHGGVHAGRHRPRSRRRRPCAETRTHDYIYIYIYISIHPSIHPSIYLSIYLSISFSLHNIYIYIYASIYLAIAVFRQPLKRGSPRGAPTKVSVIIIYIYI